MCFALLVEGVVIWKASGGDDIETQRSQRIEEAFRFGNPGKGNEGLSDKVIPPLPALWKDQLFPVETDGESRPSGPVEGDG